MQTPTHTHLFHKQHTLVFDKLFLLKVNRLKRFREQITIVWRHVASQTSLTSNGDCYLFNRRFKNKREQCDITLQLQHNWPGRSLPSRCWVLLDTNPGRPPPPPSGTLHLKIPQNNNNQVKTQVLTCNRNKHHKTRPNGSVINYSTLTGSVHAMTTKFKMDLFLLGSVVIGQRYVVSGTFSYFYYLTLLYRNIWISDYDQGLSEVSADLANNVRRWKFPMNKPLSENTADKLITVSTLLQRQGPTSLTTRPPLPQYWTY